jgi:mRNA-degrading endonuclease toxin of MazEF toxin-antitoxin module
MEKKDFNGWLTKKKGLHHYKKRVFFHEREVWFAALGVNVGFEQDGRGDAHLRPVIVLRKFNNEVLWCLPLTKNQKKGNYYFTFNLNEELSTAILSQIRLIDAKRLQYKIGDITPTNFILLKIKLRQLLA